MDTYLSELFSSIQGEGPYIGERHFFIRFCGCHRKCVFCDTDVERSKNVMIEKIPGSGVIDNLPNPISSRKILELINMIDHNRNCKKISVTGGEPLLQGKFLCELLPLIKKDNREIYLETSGDLIYQLELIVEWINYASVDIKLSSVTKEKNSFLNHWKFLEILKNNNVDFYTKIIISNDTDEKELVKAFKGINNVAGRETTIVLQPMTKTKNAKNIPAVTNLLRWQDQAQLYFNDVRVIPQTHKMLEAL